MQWYFGAMLGFVGFALFESLDGGHAPCAVWAWFWIFQWDALGGWLLVRCCRHRSKQHPNFLDIDFAARIGQSFIAPLSCIPNVLPVQRAGDCIAICRKGDKTWIKKRCMNP
jgi:hypothetical protein